MASVGDWGEIINKAEAERFVGRGQELLTFRKQISYTPPRYLIFYITGQGGVGKSTLLNRYREIARNFGFLLADCDEQQQDVPAILGRLAQQLAIQGFPLRQFSERYKTYRQKMNEIENDPQAPQGLTGFLGRALVRAAFVGGDMVPGLRKGLDYLPQEALEIQASEWASYLTKKLTNKDEVALIRDPISILTPLFFEDLNKIARRRKVLLCFENFEAARQDLQAWLLHLLEYRPSQNIRIVIAGRNQPDASWSSLRSATRTIRLDVFTSQEAETFLDAYGIKDTKRRMEILEWSGRLPILMSWLVAPEAQESDSAVPTQDIVELFLRWVPEPTLRQLALLAAIPRTFNVDILKLMLENPNQTADEQSAFDHLRVMPFVQQRSEGWQYHNVVRLMMLHYQRQKSPQAYRHMHAVLADFYDIKRQKLGLSERERWANEQWRKDTLSYVYHFLAANPNKNWGEAMSLFTMAVRRRRSFAVEMIELLNLDDVLDEFSSEQKSLVELLQQQLQIINDEGLQEGLKLFDGLCKIDNLSSRAKGHALAYRGECHRLNRRWEEALSDFREALKYIPKDVRTLTRWGATYVSMRRYLEALDTLNRAIELNEQDVWALAIRGETLRRLGRYQEALHDLNRAMTLDEKNTWVTTIRDETYHQMEYHQQVLDSLVRTDTSKDENAFSAVPPMLPQPTRAFPTPSTDSSIPYISSIGVPLVPSGTLPAPHDDLPIPQITTAGITPVQGKQSEPPLLSQPSLESPAPIKQSKPAIRLMLPLFSPIQHSLLYVMMGLLVVLVVLMLIGLWLATHGYFHFQV